MALLKDIDTRVPKKENEVGANLTLPNKIGRSGFAPNWKRGLSFDENGKIIDSPQTDKAGNVVSAKNIDWQDTLGNAFDVAKLGLGINGALSPLPKKTVNPEWADYMRKAKYFSQLGLSPESIALAKDTSNSDYDDIS